MLTQADVVKWHDEDSLERKQKKKHAKAPVMLPFPAVEIVGVDYEFTTVIILDVFSTHITPRCISTQQAEISGVHMPELGSE